MNYLSFNWLLTLLKQTMLLLLEQGTLSMTDGIKLLFPQIKTSFNSVQRTLAFIDRFKTNWFANKTLLMSSAFIPTILPLLEQLWETNQITWKVFLVLVSKQLPNVFLSCLSKKNLIARRFSKTATWLQKGSSYTRTLSGWIPV